MEVQLRVEQEAFIRQVIESGRLTRAEDAVQQALFLWEERERKRIEILGFLEEAEADLQTGEYRDYTDETLPLLAKQLKDEARTLGDPAQINDLPPD
jgi:Arc/MetJ-type ribon-helix-helix transcriptional regulator